MTEQTGGRRESLKQQDSAAGVLQGAVSRRLVLWNCVVFLSSYLYFYSIPFSLKNKIGSLNYAVQGEEHCRCMLL